MPRYDMPLNTNDQSLARVLNAGLPVALVVGDMPLAAPLDETLSRVAKSEAGKLLVARLDAHDNPLAAAQVTAARPALITYRAGQPLAEAARVTPETLLAHVDYLLGRGPRPAAQPASESTTTSQPIAVSDSTFQREVMESDLPVLLDLWAPWCGPCHMIAPVVEKMAGDYAGRLKVAKLNVDDNPRTAGSLGVQGIPTLLIFRAGKVVDRIVGAMPEPVLRGRVDTALRR